MPNWRANARRFKLDSFAIAGFILRLIPCKKVGFVSGATLQYVTATMETKIFSWLGREFVEISGEAQAGASVESSDG